jgi:tetratricopeptide (TPR) repeat protein
VTAAAVARVRASAAQAAGAAGAGSAAPATVPAVRPPARMPPAPVSGLVKARAEAGDPWTELGLADSPDARAVARQRQGRWLLALAGALGGMLLIALFWPRSGPDTAAPPSHAQSASSVSPAAGSLEPRFRRDRSVLEKRLVALDARGAGEWGGADWAAAKTLAAEANGAHDAGNATLAEERLLRASAALDAVEKTAASALVAAMAAGEKALAAGQQEQALAEFERARHIDPSDLRVLTDERRARALNSVLPRLAAARNAETAHNYVRAMQEYSHVLSLDPGNPGAQEGLARSAAAAGSERFAKAIGRGFTALAAGRLGEAKMAFEKARALRPGATEPVEGLRRVAADFTSRGFSALRTKALALEAQGRWDEAGQLYDSVLQQDPSMVFALQGRARADSHAGPARALQALLDRPQQLIIPERAQKARELLHQLGPDASPAARAQAARLTVLLGQLDTPVHFSLVSDNATLITISNVGSLGAFGHRDIDLKPGQYTVTGTRDGYREVRREITVAPGEENATISISCSEPIAPT